MKDHPTARKGGTWGSADIGQAVSGKNKHKVPHPYSHAGTSARSFDGVRDDEFFRKRNSTSTTAGGSKRLTITLISC